MGLYDRDYMRPQPRTFLDVLRGLNALHVIIWVNIIVFVAQYLFGIGGQKLVFEDGSETFMPYGGVSVQSLAAGHVWTALTYMFVHGSLLHIGGNLLMIYFVGKRVLALLGTRNFLNIYFLSGLVGAAAELFITGWYYLRLIGYGGSPMTYERLWREKPSAPFGRRQEMVKARHRRLSEDLELDLDTPRKPSNPTADIIREEVDPILEKISEQGMSSLTDDERRTLERASREISRIPGRNL